MKLKYIFASIVATLALAVSCEKEADHYLDAIKVSSSYVSLSTGVGANASITVTATDSWTITVDKEGAKWLTVTPTSGSAGETTVTFTAPAYEGGHTAEVTITCGDKTQFVNVIQGVKTVSEVTCAEVMKNPGKTYRVTGTVTRIANTVYGNWNMDDGTYDYSSASADNKAGLYIYGTLDNKGNTKNFTYWNLEVGDQITVEGPSKDYNGTIELVDVTVVKIVKSLIKVKEVTPANATLEKEGGDILVTLTNKGNNLGVVIPEDAKSWLGISALNGDEVTLTATPNEGGDRETTVTFKTTDGSKGYSCELAITQKGAIIDATVAQFLAAEVGTVQYRLTGVITSEYVSDKQGQSFYLKDATGEVLVYRLNDYKASGAKVGDVITVVGQRGAYKETAQMVSGVYESHIPVSKITVSEFLACPVSTESLYCLTGEITGEYASDKQGQSFYLKDATGEVLIYRLNDYKASGAKVGDIITVVGQRGAYKENPQMVSGMYVSHQAADNGGGNGGDNGGVTVTSPYVLAVTAGSNNSYAANCDIEIGGLTWNLTGNATMDPWRIGGKSITDTDRELYSKTAISFDVAKIEVEHGTASDITVNSFKLIVSKNSDFSSPVSTLTGTVTANGTTTFTRPEGVSWKGCYFKFVYNLTVSGSSNKFVQFKKATFTE